MSESLLARTWKQCEDADVDGTAKAREFEPSFVSSNLASSASALLVVDDPYAKDGEDDETLLLSGCLNGDIYVYDIVGKNFLGLAYSHPVKETNKDKLRKPEDVWLQKSSPENLYTQLSIVQMGKLSTTAIWVQFRNGFVGLFGWMLQEKALKLQLKSRIPFHHMGFCRAVYDQYHERFIIPDSRNGNPAGFFTYDDQENLRYYDISDAELRNSCTQRRDEVEKQRVFSGAIMFIQSYHLDAPNLYFMGFEDSSIALYDVEAGVVVDWFQIHTPNRPSAMAMIAIDQRVTTNSDRMDGTTFIMARPDRILCVYFDPREHRFIHVTTVKMLPPEHNCTVLSFIPEVGTRPLTDTTLFAAGYVSGLVEVYSLSFNTHTNSFVSTLLYSSHYVREIIKDKIVEHSIVSLGWSLRWRILFAATKNGKIIHYEDVRFPTKKKQIF